MTKCRAKPSKSFASELSTLFVGLPITVERSENGWELLIGTRLRVMTDFWRLLGPDGIVTSSDDDGHWFGLPQSVDAKARADDALAGMKISEAALDDKIGDLRIEIGTTHVLEIITWSAGYESWQLFQDDEFFAAVANGGLV